MSPLAMHDAYFVRMYATDPDPWGFDSSWYEQRKYALTLAALPERRYERAVEPGCANGALTALLADTTRAVVRGSQAILVLDAIWAVLLL